MHRCKNSCCYLYFGKSMWIAMTEDSEVWSTLNRTAVSYDSKERSEPEIEMIFVYVEKLFVSLLEFEFVDHFDSCPTPRDSAGRQARTPCTRPGPFSQTHSEARWPALRRRLLQSWWRGHATASRSWYWTTIISLESCPWSHRGCHTCYGLNSSLMLLDSPSKRDSGWLNG